MMPTIVLEIKNKKITAHLGFDFSQYSIFSMIVIMRKYFSGIEIKDFNCLGA